MSSNLILKALFHWLKWYALYYVNMFPSGSTIAADCVRQIPKLLFVPSVLSTGTLESELLPATMCAFSLFSICPYNLYYKLINFVNIYLIISASTLFKPSS